jgi:hypothetical protein
MIYVTNIVPLIEELFGDSHTHTHTPAQSFILKNTLTSLPIMHSVLGVCLVYEIEVFS